jgi:hypothetical protein
MKIRILIICLIIASCVNRNAYEKTEANYGNKIDVLAEEFNLSKNYLKALVILESSGEKNIKARFEAHVYKALVRVREGKRKSYEGITQNGIKDASDGAIRNLASSWGPFQIMGYKCLKLNIKVEDLRGPKAIYWGIVWIDKNYGTYIRQERFKEAFRIHNSGSPQGKTHDPNYVKNGLKHIDYFKNQSK